MREKTLQAVATFATTSDAMAMEAAARERGIAGRIIPVPSQIDAGCGLAWTFGEPGVQRFTQLLEQHAIAFEGVYEVAMY